MVDAKKEEKRFTFTFGDEQEPPPPTETAVDARDDGRDFWEAFFTERGIFAGRDE